MHAFMQYQSLDVGMHEFCIPLVPALGYQDRDQLLFHVQTRAALLLL
jgi:hypothetical protein